MKFAVFFTLIICLYSCSNSNLQPSKNLKRISLKEIEIKDSMMYYDKNLFTGLVYEETDNVLLTESDVVNGKETGYFKRFFSNGKLAIKAATYNNYIHGPYVEYYTDGSSVRALESYCFNSLCGSSQFFDKNGQLISSGFYKENKKDSLWVWPNSVSGSNVKDIYKYYYKDSIIFDLSRFMMREMEVIPDTIFNKEFILNGNVLNLTFIIDDWKVKEIKQAK